MGLLSLLLGDRASQPTSQTSGSSAPPSTTNPLGIGYNSPLSLPPVPGGYGGGSNGAANPYDNAAAVNQVQQALQADQPRPGGNTRMPGLWGLLPDSMQHGSLRSVIGGIGDAFQKMAGEAQSYQPRQDEMLMGNAMAGVNMDDPASIQAATSRLAASGAPGAAEAADKLQTQAENLQMRKAALLQAQAYHEITNNTKIDSVFARLSPVAQGAVGNSKSLADYTQRYNLLDKRAKAIDPTTDASTAFGIPAPEDWQNTPGFGLTANQQQVAATAAAGQASGRRNTDVKAGATIGAAKIAAAARLSAQQLANMKPSDADTARTIMNIPPENRTPEQQAWWDANVTRKNTAHGRAHGGLAAGLNPGATGSGPAAQPQANTSSRYAIGTVATGPGGKKITWNGHAWQ